MQTITIINGLKFETICCACCAITFAVPSRFCDDHKTFYCPSGHRNYYAEESKEEKLKRKLAAVEKSSDYYREKLEEKRRSLTATKAHLTRKKNEIKKLKACPPTGVAEG